MKAREIACYRVYCRVRAYLNAYPVLFAEINATGIRREFDRLVDRLAALVADSETLVSTTQGAVTRVEALRQELFDCHITPIVTFGLALKGTKLKHLVIKMPAAQQDVTSLHIESMSLRSIVAPHQALFVEMGLAPDFLDQLMNAADALAAAATNRDMKRCEEGGMTIGSAEAVTHANAHLRALGALVVKRVREHPELLAEWNGARKLPSHKGKADGVDGSGAPRLRPGTPTRVIARVITSTPKLIAAPSAGVEIAQPDVTGEHGQTRGLIAGVRRLLSGA